jgi:hypothetical protein
MRLTAVSELLYAEAIRPSGLFLQEKATLPDSGNGDINSETALATERCSSGAATARHTFFSKLF